MTPTPDATRTLPVLWGAIGAGGTMAATVLALLHSDPPPMADQADAAFYGVALLSVLLTGVGFALIRRLDEGGASPERIRTLGLGALAVTEIPAIASGLAAFLTGNMLALAFVVPFLAFVALTWPTPERVARWTGTGGR